MIGRKIVKSVKPGSKFSSLKKSEEPKKAKKPVELLKIGGDTTEEETESSESNKANERSESNEISETNESIRTESKKEIPAFSKMPSPSTVSSPARNPAANAPSITNAAVSSQSQVPKNDTPIAVPVQPKPEKKGIFAELKDSILNAMGSKKQQTEEQKNQSQRLTDGKIDMAYLKATIQDTLKQKPKTQATQAVQKRARVPSGIDGFDEIVEGGLVKDSIVLVAGGPGSGKTILGMQFLVNGIEKYNDSAVYISFESEPETIIEDMDRFNWNLRKKIEDKKLAILYYSPEQVDRVIYIGGGPVREVIEDLGAKRIVIDSITAFTLLYKTENERRRALVSLFKTLKKWRCTTILISEETLCEEHSSTVEEYAAEGVVFMYNVKKGDVRERSIEIFKMRGTDHSTKIIPIRISPEGITIYPDEQVY